MVNQGIYYCFTLSRRFGVFYPPCCSEEISLHLIMTAPRGAPSAHPHSSWQETINSWLRWSSAPGMVSIMLWMLSRPVSLTPPHPPDPRPPATLTSPKPRVIHEPLPCETEWPTQAKLTSPSVLMEPFVTATSCISPSAANSLGSDRGVSEYRQLLIYSLIITCLICHTDSMLPFSWSRSAILFCQQFVDWVLPCLGFMHKKKKTHQSLTEIKDHLTRSLLLIAAGVLFNRKSRPSKSGLFHWSASGVGLDL